MNNNSAFKGLFSGIDRTQQAKDNLIVAEKLASEVDKKREQDRKDQAEVAAMQEQIRKETDQLLGYDKKLIREQARGAFNIVKNKLAAYGGNYSAFLNNGGRAMIDNYKSSILNSNSMADYQENQKNMANILEMEKKGLGHLVNAVDRANMLDYQRNKGGKVTYTGQLLDIKMPDLNNYDWNTDVPAQHILDSNRMAILNNYKLNHPNLKFPPEESDLISYVKENHYARGANWQRGHQERSLEQSNQHFWAGYNQRDRHFDAEMAQRKYEYEDQSYSKTLEAKLRMLSGDDGTGGSKGVNSNDFGEESFIANVGQVNQMISNDGQGLTAAEFLSSDFWKKNIGDDKQKGKYADDLAELGLSDYVNKSYNAKALAGDNWFSSISRGAFQGTLSPANAKLVRNIDKEAAAKTVFGNTYEIKNGKVLGLSTYDNKDIIYGANGQPLTEMKGLGGYVYGSMAGKKTRDFNIKGVILAGYTESGGKRQILMDEYNTFGKKKDNRKELANRVKDSKVYMGNFLALEHPDTRETVYVELKSSDVNVQAKYASYNATDNIGSQRKKIVNAYGKYAYGKNKTQAKIASDTQGLQSMLNDENALSKISKKAKIVGPPNKDNYRAKLLTSFYVANTAYGGGDLSLYNSTIDDDMFDKLISSVMEKNPKASNLKSILKDPMYTDEKLIIALAKLDPQNAEFYREWSGTLKHIKTN